MPRDPIPLAETFVRIRPDASEVDEYVARLRNLTADLTDAFDRFLEGTVLAAASLTRLIERANADHEDE